MTRNPSHSMSHSPRSFAVASPPAQSIKISSLLNESMQSSPSKKVAMPPSGLPTPDSTPVQQLISESTGHSFQDSPLEAIDPAVLPRRSSKDDTREVSLFPENAVTVSNDLSPSQNMPQSRAVDRSSFSSSFSKPSFTPRHRQRGHVARSQSISSDLMDVAFQEDVPAEVWYQFHISDKAGVERPETVAFKSQLWTAASIAPKEYANQLTKTSHELTFASGKAPGLNWLSTVCENEPRVAPTPSRERARPAIKSESARRVSKIESRQPSHRRPSIKKRSNADGAEPEAKRMRAAAVHKEKPSSYLEVPDYSPSLSTFNAASVKAFVPKGGRIDLSNDPLIELVGTELNHQEKSFAEVNQLDVNKYLINKRKIFQGRIQVHLQGKKSFTKTHAQQAAIIDVNKASRMWEFFDQAGWLDMKHFKKFIPIERANMLAKHIHVATDFLN